ncbi:MAG: xanthine dehydrogenase family protein molybdopterin-binding subunit [Gammaproteobacteria bacterium]|nr:xanthine dehydrogenase family protein molybdopterin-binding subunit [Gammaproteobacteria bacterium]
MSAPFELPFEKYAVGQSAPRTEDPRLLRGDGCYADDIGLADQAYAYVFRSPYGHGVISRLDVGTARAGAGVLKVITAEDLTAAGIGHLPCGAAYASRDGTPLIKPTRPSLATDRVRYRGEAVAVVVAQTLLQARDACELIDFEVEQLPSVTDAKEALADGAPTLHSEAPNNQALDWEFGDEKGVDEAFASAKHVTSISLRNNRVVVSAMEPRALTAQYDPGTERYTLHVPSQGVFGLHNGMARVMGVDPKQVRVRTYDVGGSFGMKGAPYPEYAPVLLAARELGRPVKWCDERSDSFLSDQHGRDSWAEASIAFDEAGHIVAARVVNYANLGAYLTAVGPNMQTGNIRKNFPSVYRLPKFHVRTLAAFTNTTPIGAYRGAGRPEGVYYMERLLDNAAREMGIDRVELRRRNLISPDEMPYDAVSELTYDSGDFPAVLDKALALADWSGFEARKAQSAASGRLRGLGIACYLEVTGPPGQEMGGIKFLEDGRVQIVSGTLNYGQGHAVTFAQIVSDRLGIAMDAIELFQGDSDALLAGGGTGGSKSVIAGGEAFLTAADALVEKGLPLAAQVLETATQDIEFSRGEFRVVGTDRSIGVVALAAELRATPGAASLDTELTIDTPPSAFPNGCHVAEVEIDTETGEIDTVAYAVVDDFGTLINPMLVEGQVHGGVVQGLGQALLEHTVYDETGQLLAGSYMDYALPRADQIPDFKFDSHPVPARTNSLGAKGCGEAGTTGSLPALMNAIVDALASAGGPVHFDMPATPERVWAALNATGH